MRLSFLLGAALGYVLGSRAGRERYEDIVAISRKVAGSRPVRSATDRLKAQATEKIPGLRLVSSGRVSRRRVSRRRTAPSDGSFNGTGSN
jgi:hypothetical protein